METVRDFVTADWIDQNWYERPKSVTIEELAPYWDEFIRDQTSAGRKIPKGITLEDYVAIWNELCKAHNSEKEAY